MLTSIIGGTTYLRTLQLKNKVIELKKLHKDELDNQEKNFKDRIEILKKLEINNKEYIAEIVFLRYYVKYIESLNNYIQKDNQSNITKLKASIDNFSWYVYKKYKEFNHNTNLSFDERELRNTSSMYFIFNNKIYNVPHNIEMRVKEIRIQRGEK